MKVECAGCEKMVDEDELICLCPECERKAALYDITLMDKKRLLKVLTQVREYVNKMTDCNCNGYVSLITAKIDGALEYVQGNENG